MNDLNTIKSKIKEFEDFKNNLDKQQLTYPLDQISSDIISDKAVVFTGDFVVPAGLASPYDEHTEIITNNGKYIIVSTAFVEL